MLQLVVIEACPDSENRPALLAPVGPFAGVSTLVDHQGVHLGKRLATLGTRVRVLGILLRGDGGTTFGTFFGTQIVTEGVSCLPLVTVVPALAHVFPLVSLEVTAVHEGGVTLVTLKGPLPRVFPVVHVQLTLFWIGHATDRTLENVLKRVVLFVHVQHHLERKVLATDIALMERTVLLAGGSPGCA